MECRQAAPHASSAAAGAALSGVAAGSASSAGAGAGAGAGAAAAATIPSSDANLALYVLSAAKLDSLRAAVSPGQGDTVKSWSAQSQKQRRGEATGQW
jgi:hypothetical protein